MISFLFSHIRSHIFRSVSMIFVSGVCISILYFLFFCYINVVGVITYYNHSIVNEKRFTISGDSNFFTIFSKNSPGLPKSLVTDLENSAMVEKVQSFSLVELPVLAKFSLFSFGLETDIPVFSVSDSALTGALVPVGLSRSMIDFYNLQFAGSSAMFPQITPSFLMGQSVIITVGASKIFPSLPQVATSITGSIVTIGDDFPGFGIVVPESIIRAKMEEVGYSLGNPYKVVAYAKNTADLDIIRTKYSSYSIKLDRDSIKEFEKKVLLIRSIFVGIAVFMAGIFILFFLFLLFAFFRERRDVFRMVYIFGLTGIRARLLTLSEPIFLFISGSVAGTLGIMMGIGWIIKIGNQELLARGVSYQLILLNDLDILSIYLLFTIIFVILILVIETIWRKKSLMR
ncbi:hypothetical protein K2X92_01950 [Candidatus Gracilibacteria bacterium]|nr:hypothetical protein [Candidatus Gracilibacteria bacterium]